MAAPVIKRINENLTLASVDQIAIVYAPAKSPSGPEMTALQGHLLDAALQAPNGFGLLLVVPEEGGPPEGAVRQQVNQMFRSLKGRLKLVAGVLEGAGFAAAAKRSVFSMLLDVTTGGTTTKVFSSVDDGGNWLADQAKKAKIECPGSIDLQACVARMRT